MNQPLPLVEQLKNLEQLQALDLKIDSIKKSQTSLPASLKAIDDSLKKLRLTQELKKNQSVEFEKQLRQTQAALDLNQERIARSNGKLESVQNSQEFQAATKEVEQLRKLQVTLEEQKKKALMDHERVTQELRAAEEELRKVEAERESQHQVLLGQGEVLTTDLNQLLKERAKYTSFVETRVLSLYDRVRAARAGIGVAAAVSGRCKVCNMIVPPQMYNELHKGSALHSCPSCNRILYVPSTSAEATSVATAQMIGV